MHSLLFTFLIFQASSAALTFYSVTSSSYFNRIPNISPLRVLKLLSDTCNRRCVMDSDCWSCYVSSANGTVNCILVGVNLCPQPDLTLVTPTFNTKWWEKVADFAIPCLTRNATFSSQLFTNASNTSPTSISTLALITKGSTNVTSSTSTTKPAPACTANTCKTCMDCISIKGGSPGPVLLDMTYVLICTLWPNGTDGITIRLPCFGGDKAGLFYRKTYVNTTSRTEFVLTPEEMHWIDRTSFGSNLEIRFRTLGLINNIQVIRYSDFSVNSMGELSLGYYIGYYVDMFGAPIVNAPFVNNSFVNPACGPFWDLSASQVANIGTAFNATPCPGYPMAFYGQPGFYNNIWSSGMAGPFNETIIEMLVYKW